MHDIETRLAKLERENRWLKRAGAVFATVALVVVFCSAKDAPKRTVIEANEIRIVDSTGFLRGTLGVDKADGAVGLALMGADGTLRLAVQTFPSGSPTIQLDTPAGNGTGTISINGADEKTRFMTGYTSNDGRTISFIKDKDGKTVWRAP